MAGRDAPVAHVLPTVALVLLQLPLVAGLDFHDLGGWRWVVSGGQRPDEGCLSIPYFGDAGWMRTEKQLASSAEWRALAAALAEKHAQRLPSLAAVARRGAEMAGTGGPQLCGALRPCATKGPTPLRPPAPAAPW